MRSERLLRGIHKLASHDLPNQMVAVHGLLHLLRVEEWERLSDDGREYVRRLENATVRAAAMTRIFKEVARLHSFAIQTEAIALTALGRELQGQLQHRYPTKNFKFTWEWNVSSIVGDPRVLLQALQEIFAGLLDSAAATCDVSARADHRGRTIEVVFCLAEALSSAGKTPIPSSTEQRMELILAREWLGLLGANLELAAPHNGATRFSLLFPDR